MSRCENCGMKEDEYVVCRRPVIWKDKDGEKHLILCGLDRMLKKHNYPEEDSEPFKRIVTVVQHLSKVKKNYNNYECSGCGYVEGDPVVFVNYCEQCSRWECKECNRVVLYNSRGCFSSKMCCMCLDKDTSPTIE